MLQRPKASALLLFVAAACSSSEGPSEPPHTTGGLSVSVAAGGTAGRTGGEVLGFPVSFTVVVDGSARAVYSVGEIAFTRLEPGTRRVELTDVPVNCSVGGENPRDVTIIAGETATTRFDVVCADLVGSVQVITFTEGTDPDPDGYLVVVGGSVTFRQPATHNSWPEAHPTGDVEVELRDIADNCLVGGENPRTVTVEFDQRATARFEVTCSAVNGAIEVTTVTTGSDLPAGPYSIDLDGSVQRTIAINASETITGIRAGTHALTLSALPTNCVVTGDNPADVEVAVSETTALVFEVTCVPTIGEVRVTAETEGSPADPDGYEVSVNGSAVQPLGVSGDTISFAEVPGGDASVLLGDVEPGCFVGGWNPRPVEIADGEMVFVSFGVTCTAETADVVFVVLTTGKDLDPDGYAVSLDGAPAVPIAVNDSVTLPGVTAGVHEFLLTEIGENCETLDPNPATPKITPPGQQRVAMRVFCAEIPNTLPDIVISSPDPTPGVVPPTVMPGDAVSFTGSADDAEDGPLTGASLRWSSNVDGPIGTGEAFSTSSLSEGLHTITLTAFDSTNDFATATALLLVAPAPDPSRYDITLRLSPGTMLTPGQRAAVEAALAKLEAIVVGDVADVPFSFATGSCGAEFPPMNEILDDLVLFLSVEPIDGPGGVLGAAGPCVLRGNTLPMLGGMRVDAADLLNLESLDLVDELLLHEAMHVMGFGTIWTLHGFLELPSNPARGGVPGNDTYFDGPAALLQFQAIGGASYAGGNVVPVENNNAVYGSGSLDSHWRESVFDVEVMTPSLDVGVGPLSVLTVGQFEDLGYVVDPTAADPHSPVFQLRAPGGRQELNLGNDVLDAPVWIVGPAGAILGRIR